MAASKPAHSPEEFARRGQAIYDQTVRPALRPEDEDKFVAIDIDWELTRSTGMITQRPSGC